jgi:flagellar protein FliS
MTSPRTAYRENDVRGASPVRLVVLLYEQMIQDLTQAAQAIEQNDILLRTKRINHAILVIGHLQSPLDFANGGKVATDLDQFYNVLRQKLVEVQFHPSKLGIDYLITDLLAVREAWIEVDRMEKPSVTTAVTTTVTTAVTTTVTSSNRGSFAVAEPESDHVRMDWKG